MQSKKHQYVLFIAFDSSGIFKKNLYFTYGNVEFKLIKGTKQYRELLCSIIDVDATSGPDFEKEWDRVGNIAFKFLSSLGWEHNIGIESVVAGGMGWRKESGGLTRVRRTFLYPRHFHNLIMSPINSLPKIDNDFQSIALSLYREARNASSPYYRFLCFWKILELPYKKGHKPKEWIDRTMANNTWILKEYFRKENPTTISLGEYLWKSCRCAIAHVWSGKKPINPDRIDDISRITIGARILEELVRIFIKKELKLDSPINGIYNYLYLKKQKGKKLPEFIHYYGK